MASGFTVPVMYSILTIWSTPYEKATLMAISFSGWQVASIINTPLAAVLCNIGLDGGWPLIFYVPGAFA